MPSLPDALWRGLTQRLKDEGALREHLVAELSHDLRTPLTAATLAVQSLKRRADQPQRVQKAAYRIEYSLGRVDAMIQEILNASRLKAGGPLQIKPESCQLDVFLQRAVADLKQIHVERVVLKKPCAQIFRDYDPAALLRVVDNLVNNAFKYGDEKDLIEMSLLHVQVHDSKP